MRGWIIAFLLLVVLLAIAVSWSACLNPSKYQTELERFLGHALGVGVQIEHVSMSWHGGGLRWILEGFQCYGLVNHEPLLRSSHAVCELSLWNFFSEVIRVNDLTIVKPEIFLTKRSTGEWNWSGRKNRPVSKSRPDHKTVHFSVHRLTIRSGTLLFCDESYRPIFNTTLSHLDAESLAIRGPQAPLHDVPHDGIRVTARFHLTHRPGSEIRLTFIYSPFDQALSLLELGYEGGTMILQGSCFHLKGIPRFEGIMEIHQMDLSRYLPQGWGRGPVVSGILTARWDIAAMGTHPILVRESLKGHGAIDIRNGSIRNVNFITQSLETMALPPGMKSLMLEPFPVGYQALFSGNDTDFEILQANVRFHEGKIRVKDLLVKASRYAITGTGELDTIHPWVEFKIKLVLLEEISEYLSGKIQAIRPFLNSQGRVVIPIRWQGLLPNPKFKADAG
ncbi:MAG: AsmA-like C-terminal region-containing protein [Candidatus Omnitrophica bacterium]|nr:AsmA-like C-terminal region-containing protein [Candidatus Omnitrophota bacterium]